jgi:hypothetical protein
MDKIEWEHLRDGLCIGLRFLAGFVRWTAIFLFTLFCSIGLVLHLPGKLLLFSALVPAAAILVPRRHQKWCWAALALSGLAVWGWIHLPDGDSAEWKTYPFQTEPIEEIPENAAGHYVSLVEKTREAVFSYPYTDREDQLSYAGPWKLEQFPALSRWMDDCEPTLARLIEISRMPLCRFEVPGDPLRYTNHQLRIKVLKAWCSILVRSSNRDWGNGRLASALEKQLTIFRIARHFYQQGTLLDQATGYYLEEVAGRVLSRLIVEEADAAMLEQIESCFRQIDPQWSVNWPRILQREKLLARNLAAVFYQISPDGRTRLSRDIGRGLHEVLRYPRYRLFSSEPMTKAAVLMMWLSLPATPQDAGKLIDERFDRYARMAREGMDLEWVDRKPLWKRGLNCRSMVDWYAKQQVSFYYPLQRRDRQQKALQRAMSILIELRRFFLQQGRWPQGLQEVAVLSSASMLTDPVSGVPFVYRRTGEEFELYSLGENRQDDEGIQNLREGKDDRLYWPTPQ